MTDQEALDHIEEWEEETTALFDTATADLATAMESLDAAKALGFSDSDFEAANVTYYNGKLARDWINSDGTMVHNHEWAEELLTYSIGNSAMVVADLMPGAVTGTVLDSDGKAVSGAEVRKEGNDTVWDTTGADGSFNFSIAPGVYTFDVYDGSTKEQSFDSTVAAGAESDAGDIKFEAEDDTDDDDMTMWYIIIGVVIVVVLVLVVTMTRKGGEEE